MNKRGSFNYRNLFIEVMENFMDEAKCNRLFKKIEKLYQVKPYKITKTTG